MRIVEGVFKNQTGVVEGVDMHLRKVRVTIAEAGRFKVVEVDFYEVVRL